MDIIHQARLAQSVEHQTWNWRVEDSSPTVDKEFYILYFVAPDALLEDRLVLCKWNQAWRPSEVYRYIGIEKDNFKSREVNCLKECVLALSCETSGVQCPVYSICIGHRFTIYCLLLFVFIFGGGGVVVGGGVLRFLPKGSWVVTSSSISRQCCCKH